MSAASLLCNEDAGDVVSSDADNRISDHPSPLLSDPSAVDRLFDSDPHCMPRPDYILRCQDRAVNLAARQDSINWILKGNGWPFQLLSVACLSLAAKMEETQVPLLLDLQMFDPNFIFEPKTVQRMELLVMANLNWKLLSVTPFDFLHYFTSKLHSNGIQPDPLPHLLSTSSDLVLKTTRAINFLSFSPSIIAAAAVILSAGECADVPETFYERVNKVKNSFSWLYYITCIYTINGNGEKLSPTNGGVPGRHVSICRGNSRAQVTCESSRRTGCGCLYELRHTIKPSRAAKQEVAIICFRFTGRATVVQDQII